MLRLLSFLWSGCFHKWVAVKEATFSDDYGASGSMVFVKCSKCGHRRYFKHSAMGKNE